MSGGAWRCAQGTENEIFGRTGNPNSKFKAFHPIHLTNALRASADLKQVARLKTSFQRHLQFFFPCNFASVGERLLSKGFTVPSKSVLQRSRIRMDIVAMLLHRDRRPRSIVSRSLAYDSSPQGGQELYACVEVYVLRGAGGSCIDSQRRSMPLTQMGHGCTGVVAKAMSLIHKVALEIGFGSGLLQQYVQEVRFCVTDCGTEWVVIEMPIVIGDFL